MAITHINIDTNKERGARVRSLAQQLNAVRNLAEDLKEKMETFIDDGSDYSALETAYGLQTGDGQTVYNLVAGASTALADADIVQPVIRLG